MQQCACACVFARTIDSVDTDNPSTCMMRSPTSSCLECHPGPPVIDNCKQATLIGGCRSRSLYVSSRRGGLAGVLPRFAPRFAPRSANCIYRVTCRIRLQTALCRNEIGVWPSSPPTNGVLPFTHLNLFLGFGKIPVVQLSMQQPFRPIPTVVVDAKSAATDCANLT